MKKRLVLTTAAILSLGLLASCGGKKAEETTAKAETTAAATEKAGETTAAATEAEKAKSDLGGELNIVEKIDLDSANDFATGYVDPDHYWYTKGVTVVGFIVNDELLKSKNLEAPKTWDDLTNASYKDEVLMSNPAVSGTNYGVVNAMLQKKGEEEGWKYFTALNENVKYYSKRGADPKEKTAQGEVAIGITPMDKKVEKLATEKNCSLVYPEDGIPYVPEGVAVFKGASNVEQAKEFLNWLYNSEDNLKELAEIDGKDTIKVVLPKLSNVELSFDTAKLMKEDLSLFGSQRDSILKKWETLAGSKNEA